MPSAFFLSSSLSNLSSLLRIDLSYSWREYFSGKLLNGVFPLWIPHHFLQNLPVLHYWVNASPSFLIFVHFWSLAVEEQFYLLWPFLIGLMPTRKHVQSLCALIFFLSFLCRVLVSFHVPLQYLAESIFLPARAGELAMGGFVAMCWRDQKQWAFLCKWGVSIFFLATAAVCFIFRNSPAYWESPLSFSFGLAAISFMYAGLIILALRQGLVKTACNLSFLRLVGRYSYGLYIFHELLLRVFIWVTGKLVPGTSQTIGALVRLGVMLSITLPVTYLSFRFFELPFLRLGKHLGQSKRTSSANQ